MIYAVLFIILFTQLIDAKPDEGVTEYTQEEIREYKKRQQINNLLERLPDNWTSSILDWSRGKEGVQAPIGKAKWCSDNVHLATFEGGRSIRIWNTQTKALIAALGSPGTITAFSWAPDGKRIVIVNAKGEMTIDDLTQVFEMEKAMESLSTEQLAFMDLFIADKPLKNLDEKQKKMFDALPASIKNSLKDKLKLNIEEIQPNPKR